MNGLVKWVARLPEGRRQMVATLLVAFFQALRVFITLFIVLLVIWWLAHPVGHIAADTMQRWRSGYEEGLNDGPN